MIVEIPPGKFLVVDHHHNLTTKLIEIETSHVLVRRALHPMLESKDFLQLTDRTMAVTTSRLARPSPRLPLSEKRPCRLVKKASYNVDEIDRRIIRAYSTNSVEATRRPPRRAATRKISTEPKPIAARSPIFRGKPMM